MRRPPSQNCQHSQIDATHCCARKPCPVHNLDGSHSPDGGGETVCSAGATALTEFDWRALHGGLL
eukprot:1390359-Rhodomonas_salina.1